MRKSTTGEAKTTKKVSSKSKLQEALTKMGVLEGTFAYECVMALSSVKATNYAEADANGLGHGIVDYFVKSQICKETGEEFPDFGVINDPTNEYKKYRTNDTVMNSLYLIKANPEINTEAHSNLQFELTSGKLKFLISESEAKKKLLDTARGKKMTKAQRDEYLMPFVSTTLLERELDNLVEDREGVGTKNILLKPALKTVKHDRVSSLEYGLYYIKKAEEEGKKKSFKVSDFIFMTRG